MSVGLKRSEVSLARTRPRFLRWSHADRPQGLTTPPRGGRASLATAVGLECRIEVPGDESGSILERHEV